MYWTLKKTTYLTWQFSWTFTCTLSLRTMRFSVKQVKKVLLNFLFIYFMPIYICQILDVIFESASHFSFKFCINLPCHQTRLLCTFLVQTLYTLVKGAIRRNFFRFWVVESKLVNSSCQFWNNKSIPFQILHYFSLSWHITHLQILRSYLFYFERKGPITVPIFTLSSALVRNSFFKLQVSFSWKFEISLVS